MKSIKKSYFIIFGLIVIAVVCFSASYAIFSNTKEEHGKLNIVAGNLNYKIESSELDSDSITLEANTSKEIKIKLTSLNEVSSKYELYYVLDKVNENVSVGYSKDTKDNVVGTIDANKSKVITIVIRNDSNADSKISFKVIGGLINNELVLNDGNSLNQEVSLCHYETGYAWNFDYKGEEQEFVTPCSGNYKIELWGAQGGNDGGKGAYTSGIINLKRSTNFYIQVGGAGSQNTAGTAETISGGYNGGGLTKGQNCCNRVFGTGGGATDVRLIGGTWNNFDSLKSRIMVAAGGGGRFSQDAVNVSTGGSGGTLNGIDATGFNSDYCLGLGATQILGGKISTVGVNCVIGVDDDYTAPGVVTGGFGYGGSHGEGGNNGTGGGGGYYGGSSSGHIASAGGGSSFISGYDGCNAIANASTITNIIHTGQSNHYSGYVFNKSVMISGDDIMPTYDGTSTMTGNSGNGYAKITYLGD